MHQVYAVRTVVLAMTILCGGTLAHAESGDDEAVAKARRDYEEAKQSHDAGLINAMKITLDVQLAKAKARAAKKEQSKSKPRLDAGS